MGVKTNSICGRRPLRFDSYGDLLLDAELLVLGDVVLLGNWTLGQILCHLALSMHASIDGLAVDVPWWRQMLMRARYRRQLLSGPMPAGLNLPAEAAELLQSGPASAEEGLAALREAIERLSFETERARHPLLGEMNLDEWDSFHLRHAELHLSFALPVNVPALV